MDARKILSLLAISLVLGCGHDTGKRVESVSPEVLDPVDPEEPSDAPTHEGSFQLPAGFTSFGVATRHQDGVVVGGTLGEGDDAGVALLRFKEDGRRDAAWAVNGAVSVAALRYASCIRVVDGGVLVFGMTKADSLGLVRVDETGSVDPAFGTSGAVVWDVPFVTYPAGCEVDAEGTFRSVGTKDGRLTIFSVELTTSAATSRQINVAGISFPGWTTRLIVDESDRMLVLGNFGIVRLSSDLALDQAFGTGGAYQFPHGMYPRTAVANGEDIYVGGDRVDEVSRYPFFTRLSASGVPRPDFGVDGFVVAEAESNVSLAKLFATNGSVIAAGYSPDFSTTIVVEPSGALNSVRGPHAQTVEVTDAALLEGGKLIGVGVIHGEYRPTVLELPSAP